MSISSVKPLVSTIAKLISDRTGLLPGKALYDAIEEVAGDDLGALARALENSNDSHPTWQAIMRALMIGETYFFRQWAQLNWLKQSILPTLLKGRGNIVFWSAGCATGEEIYSLAITLYENTTELQRQNIQLIGSDLNRAALETARRGIYREWSFRHTESALRERYFDRVENGYQIKPFIRQMVIFTPNNLLIGTPLKRADVIFCCNVLLYLSDKAIQRVEDQFFDALVPGGWLLLGQAETVRTERERWLTHLYNGGMAYQKPVDGVGQRGLLFHRPAQPTPSPNKIEPQSLYDKAVTLFRAKQTDEAETILREILATQPEDDRAHILLGGILANRRQIEDAHTELDAALNHNPLQADAHYLKGMLYLEAQQWAAAEEAFKSALYCHKGHPLTAVMLGNLYTQSGTADKARRIWNSALENLEGDAKAFISDLSDLSVEAMRELLHNQINETQNP